MVAASAPQALRGEVWLARLDPTVGSEIQKTRPCLVVSPDVMNRNLGTIIVLPLTSGSRFARFRPATNYDGKEGFLLGDQMRSISKQRLIRRLRDIDSATLAATLSMLRQMFKE